MKPLLMRSPMTGQLYIVTRYRDRGEGRFLAQTKYEVPDEMLEAVGLQPVPEPDDPNDDLPPGHVVAGNGDQPMVANSQFGEIKAFGHSVVIAVIEFEERLVVGYGDTRMQALEAAFKQQMPNLERVAYSPQVLMGGKLADPKGGKLADPK